ncbi:MAG TPA: hypothetical protein VL689_10440 [Paraburkholderia sp.]|jgi:hypothetical protein|nr:hypothetical protein [Paraburkholderia sp.]
MTIWHRHTTRNRIPPSVGNDTTFVLLAISLAAFAMSCIVLFGLAMSKSASAWQIGESVIVIATMGAISWRLRRAYRREPQPGDVASAIAPADAAPAAEVQRFSELRTTACRQDASDGKGFAVRCFRVNCPSPHACPEENAQDPPRRRP